MCGIFGVIGQSDNAPQTSFNGLKDIEYRGYDSWGIAYWKKDGKWKINKKTGFLPSSLKFPSSRVSLGHTRWATHGGVTVSNAHPHTDCSEKLTIVHNGIVENYEILKKSLKKHTLKSETDTEIIIHLIEDSYKKTKNLTKSVLEIFRKLKGLNAIVVSDGNIIVAAKISSPIVVGSIKDQFYIASDQNAILPFTKNLLFLEDNQLVQLGKKLALFDIKSGNEINFSLTQVDWKYSTSSLDKYTHFMEKEIFEQPKVLKAIAVNSKELSKVARMIKKARGSYFIGCGSAAYACLAGIYLFSKIAKKHVNFSIGSEFNYNQDFLNNKSLLIAVSQSGESIDVVEPVAMAKEKGVKIVSLVNVLGSTLYRMSDFPVLLQAGVEKGVASTKAFIAMISNMIFLAYSLNGEEKLAKEILIKSAEEVESVLRRKKEIETLAGKLKNEHHVYVLGRGLSYPLALESALKIKEISYIHAEGFAGGELKHGPIALIEKGTPVLVYAPLDETKEAILANAMEVKARGAYLIGISDKPNPIFDFYFEVKDTGASSLIPNVVFAQLLSYFLTTKLGLNPDKPRNLAKSVVVR